MTAKSINADASTHMTTEGGTHIDGHVDIDGGDFVGRDKIVIKQDSPHEVYGLLNPYLGLRAFEFKDRAIYAGREQSTSDAVEKLVDPINPQKLLFITGPSGSGKSSFAQASLLPKLEEHYQKRGKIVRYAIFRPSSHPLIMLEDALVQLHVAMRFSNGKIVGTPTDQVNVLVIDQFEEALVQSDVTQQQEFFHFLTTLPPFFESQTHIIVTLRADYLKELFALEHLWNIAKDGIELRTMRADELSDAIQRPIQIQYPHKRLEPELLNHIVKDASGDSTFLPLLQVTLQELWKKGSLTLRYYGQLTDAIRHRAETIYKYVDHSSANPHQERSPQEQHEILEIFLDLVNVSPDVDDRRDVRQRRTRRDLERGSLQRGELIEELINARLLSVKTETQYPVMKTQYSVVETIDIIHETLIGNWDRLQRSVEDKRQQLQQRARFELQLKLWLATKREDDHLLSGIQLAEAQALKEREDISLQSADGQEFYNLSIKADQERKQATLALQTNNRRLLLLNRVAQLLTSTLDMGQVIQQFVRTISELLDTEGSSVWLWDEAPGSSLICAGIYSHGQNIMPDSILRLKPGQGVAGWVAQHGKSVHTSNITTDVHINREADNNLDFETQSLLAVPLQAHNKTIGVLELVNKRYGVFNESDRVLAETLAASAAIAIENARLMKDIRQHRDELQARYEELDAFAHTVAHDLKDPLTLVLGFADMLYDMVQTMSPSEVEQILRIIIEVTKKMFRMVDGMLLLATIRNTEEIEITEIDMGFIINETIKRIEFMSKEYSAEIMLPNDWPTVYGYEPWLEEVWYNYLTNGLKYGGRPPKLELGYDILEDKKVQFWVKDNGEGFSLDSPEEIFKPLSKPYLTKDKTGHGFGLSIVRRIIERLGGNVGVESQLGQGSKFCFSLPLNPH